MCILVSLAYVMLVLRFFHTQEQACRFLEEFLPFKFYPETLVSTKKKSLSHTQTASAANSRRQRLKSTKKYIYLTTWKQKQILEGGEQINVTDFIKGQQGRTRSKKLFFQSRLAGLMDGGENLAFRPFAWFKRTADEFQYLALARCFAPHFSFSCLWVS